jgi:hypothetical protein
VSPFQLGAALVVLAGAVVALSARDIRLVLGGLVVALSAAGLVADPLPSILALSCRLVAALLGAELILVALRGRIRESSTPPLGPIGPVLAAGAAFVAGWAAPGLSALPAGPTLGPAAATAAGFGLATIALGPVLLGRDLLRIGLGVSLLLAGASLVEAGLAGTQGPLEQLAWAILGLVVLAVTAALARTTLSLGETLAIEDGVPRMTLFEAHRLGGPLEPPGSAIPAHRATSGRRGRATLAHFAGAHQLTLEERLRRPVDPAGGGLAAPTPEEADPGGPEPSNHEPAPADPDGAEAG